MVVVMVALALRIVTLLAVMVMMVVMLMLVVIVMVVVMVALALRIVALLAVMVMVMMVLMLHLLQLMLEAVFIHGLKDLRAGELIPGGGDETGLRVQGLEDLGGLEDLFGLDGAGAAHDDEVGVGNLIVEEFAEIAGVHFGLARVHDGDLRADVRALHALHRGGDIGQLADARRLDEDTVGGELVHDLFEGLGEVAHQSAADAAGIHLRDLDARVLQEAAVNGDLAELVLDEDELFVLVALRDQLADERGFPRAEKAGENVYSCHGFLLPSMFYFPLLHYITLVNAPSVQNPGHFAPEQKHLPFVHKEKRIA